MRIGAGIRYYREFNAMSEGDLAYVVNTLFGPLNASEQDLTAQDIAEIEADRSEVTYMVAVAITKVLDVSIDQLRDAAIGGDPVESMPGKILMKEESMAHFIH